MSDDDRIVVVPDDPQDAEKAKRLTDYINSPSVREEIERRTLIMVLYGPDESGWPS